MQCLICRKVFPLNSTLADAFIFHLKNEHLLKPFSDFQCPIDLCRQNFSDIYSFKRHIKRKHVETSPTTISLIYYDVNVALTPLFFYNEQYQKLCTRILPNSDRSELVAWKWNLQINPPNHQHRAGIVLKHPLTALQLIYLSPMSILFLMSSYNG